jgi:hypothetical protein
MNTNTQIEIDVDSLAMREFHRLRKYGYNVEWALDKACEFAYNTDDLDSVDEDELCNLKAWLYCNDIEDDEEE